MKRLKQVTKREKKAMAKFVKEMAEQQPQTDVLKTLARVKPRFSLKKYLADKAQRKATKLQFRQEKRELKENAKHIKLPHEEHEHGPDHEHHDHKGHNHS